MNQVVVEAGTLEWVEQELPIEEPNNSKAKIEEEIEMINFIIHYMLHEEQHIPVYQTILMLVVFISRAKGTRYEYHKHETTTMLQM